MSEPIYWPGQTERHYFDLAQVTTIASAVTAEVFWTFDKQHPYSAADIGKVLGRPTPTIRYHVNQLLEVGLIFVAETRKRRSRTEEAYVHSSLSFWANDPPHAPEYAEQMMRGFDSILKQLHRERTLLLKLVNQDLENRAYGAFSWSNIRLTKQGAQQFRKVLHEKIAELEALDSSDPSAIRTKLFVHYGPSLRAAKALYQQTTGEEFEDDAE